MQKSFAMAALLAASCAAQAASMSLIVFLMSSGAGGFGFGVSTDAEVTGGAEDTVAGAEALVVVVGVVGFSSPPPHAAVRTRQHAPRTSFFMNLSPSMTPRRRLTPPRHF